MNVSLVVPTLNNESVLSLCLGSLKNQLKSGDEIIVVDSYSKDKTARIARSFGAKLIKSKGNRSVARNIGWKAAKNDVVIFVESDSVYKSDYVSVVKKRMADKDAACLLDKRELYNPDTWVSKTLQAEFISRYRNNFVPQNAWIFRKKVLEETGGFDERLEYAEDADLGLRVKAKGYEIMFERKAVQYHLGEPRTIVEIVGRAWKFGKNMNNFYEKYNNTPWVKIALFCAAIVFPPIIAAVILIKILKYNLNITDRIKLAIITTIRSIVFSISYIINLFYR